MAGFWLRKSAVITAVALAVALLSGCGQAAVDLHVGQCFYSPPAALSGHDQEITNVQVGSCARPHNSEVIAIKDIPGDTFPGELALMNLAEATCGQLFAEYVGIPFKDSRLDMYPLLPTKTGWEKTKDRALTCVVYDSKGRNTSVKDANE